MKPEPTKKVVLTGGPCAGKTTLTKVIGRAFQREVVSVPESASLLFSGGFPRWPEPGPSRAAQRAIYHVQLELEAAFETKYPGKILVLDRCTIDGAVYWPEGTSDFFSAQGTTLAEQISRYSQVIFLETAPAEDYLAHASANPSRTENWDQARKLDQELKKLWNGHSKLTVIRSHHSFSEKISKTLELVGAETRERSPATEKINGKYNLSSYKFNRFLPTGPSVPNFELKKKR